ncbi:MAG: hypothetical protein KDD65_04140 [Bacteroidetes bacterium]|nr:hypothetical protein [Bacteroidota bacterium]
MAGISSEVADLVRRDPMLDFGMREGLLNLTRVAHYIRPLVMARVHRDVSVSSIVMALSRLQRSDAASEGSSGGASGTTADLGRSVGESSTLVDRLTVQSGLAVVSLTRTAESHKTVQRIFARMQADGSHATVSEGVREIALILEQKNLRVVESALSEKPLQVVRDVAGLSVHIADAAIEEPRVLYSVLQQVALQNISVIEIASTRSEFHLYLSERDVMLAFDSIYSRFADGVRGGAIPSGGRGVRIRR